MNVFQERNNANSLVLEVHKEYLKGNKNAYSSLLFGLCNDRIDLLIETSPNGNQDYKAISNAIHELYDVDSRCKEGYEEGLIKLCEMASGINMVKLIYNYICFEEKKQLLSCNNFVIDTSLIKKALKETLIKRKEQIINNNTYNEKIVKNILNLEVN